MRKLIIIIIIFSKAVLCCFTNLTTTIFLKKDGLLKFKKEKLKKYQYSN